MGSYTISVPATWKGGIAETSATVYQSFDDDRLPEVVARGTARVRKIGEPLSVAIPGWKPGVHWDKLGGTQGPGEWVTEAYPTDEAMGLKTVDEDGRERVMFDGELAGFVWYQPSTLRWEIADAASMAVPGGDYYGRDGALSALWEYWHRND